MDKWKDTELAKMRHGGNRNARDFLESQVDWDARMPLQDKYNSRAAALYRDKLATEARGESWSIETSDAAKYEPKKVISSSGLKFTNTSSSGGDTRSGLNFDDDWGSYNAESTGSGNGGYQQGGTGSQYGGFGVNGARSRSDYAVGGSNDAWGNLSSTVTNLTSNAGSFLTRASTAAGQRVTELSTNVNEKVSLTCLLFVYYLNLTFVYLYSSGTARR